MMESRLRGGDQGDPEVHYGRGEASANKRLKQVTDQAKRSWADAYIEKTGV